MKEFIARNKQIFITGAFIGGIFLLIIFISSARKAGNSILAPSDTDTNRAPEAARGINPGLDQYRPKGEWNAPAPVPELPNPNLENFNEEDLVEETDEILEIVFDENGFTPFKGKAIIKQTVRWTNKTDQTIYIQQSKDFFPEFKEPVEIAPSGSLEFKLTKKGVWSYKEITTGKVGSIYIVIRVEE